NELGFYSIAQLIVVSLMIIPNTINQILLPKFSGYTNDIKKAIELFQKAYRKLIICVIGITFLAYLLCPLVIPVVFGEQYHNSIIYLNILLAGFMFWGMYSLKGIFLFAIGAVKYNFYTNLISFLINIILNLILIKHFEVIGAAVATTSTYFLTIFINNYYYNKVIKNLL
ncbi:polysaccharide biosynthesis C-terminal domain-containing protein, partial [Bacillus thuringiensis]|nr:polysaccharide biosynthesis C-terminal domain-containing protein [Bacillus thuringiensis]